jgi:hypothetical protein
MLAVLISNISYIVIAPFLPLEFTSKGVGIDALGVIFAAFPVASILASLILTKF